MGLFLRLRAAAGLVGAFCLVIAFFAIPTLWQKHDPDHALWKDIVGLPVLGVGGFFVARWGFGYKLQIERDTIAVGLQSEADDQHSPNSHMQ
jgi:hypothetical protein